MFRKADVFRHTIWWCGTPSYFDRWPWECFGNLLGSVLRKCVVIHIPLLNASVCKLRRNSVNSTEISCICCTCLEQRRQRPHRLTSRSKVMTEQGFDTNSYTVAHVGDFRHNYPIYSLAGFSSFLWTSVNGFLIACPSSQYWRVWILFYVIHQLPWVLELKRACGNR